MQMKKVFSDKCLTPLQKSTFYKTRKYQILNTRSPSDDCTHHMKPNVLTSCLHNSIF